MKKFQNVGYFAQKRRIDNIGKASPLSLLLSSLLLALRDQKMNYQEASNYKLIPPFIKKLFRGLLNRPWSL